MKRISFLILLFFLIYFLSLIQTSFLVFFPIKGMVINLVLISVFIMNFFEKAGRKSGLVLAILSGIILDFFSEKFFGFFILIFLSIAIFIKLVFKKYVRISALERF